MEIGNSQSSSTQWSKDDLNRLLLIVLVVGAFWAFQALTGSRYLIYPDAMEYAQTARSLSEGHGATTNTIWTLRTAYPLEFPAPDVRRPLLWPAVISIFFRIFGAVDWVVILASGCVGCASAGLFFMLCRRFFPPRPAFFTALVFVFQPQVILMNQSGLSEPLFTLLLLGICYVWLRAERLWHFLMLGLLLGLGQWIRLNGFLLAVPVVIHLVWRRDSGWSRRLLWLLVGSSLVLLPLAVRNYVHLGEFSIMNLNRYIIVSQIPPYPNHGAERALERISVLSVFASNPGAVFSKYVEGLSQNLTALFQAVHPLLWGLWLLSMLDRKGEGKVRRLGYLCLSLLGLFWLSFSIGEYEGVRFYVPLAALIVLGGMVGLYRLLESGESPPAGAVPSRRIGWKLGGLLIILVLPGFFHIREAALSPPSADRSGLAAFLHEMLPEDAVVASDTPWAVGWYGRRFSTWLPVEPEQMAKLNDRLPVDYVVLTHSVYAADWKDTRWPHIFTGSIGLKGYRRIFPVEGSAGVVILKREET